MLNLVHLHHVLRQVLSSSDALHTAILMTPAGHLISYASSDPARPKDKVYLVIGLSIEVWQEEKAKGLGVIDSEVGRIAVIPVRNAGSGEPDPLMLVALNATDKVSTVELETKGNALADYLSKTLSRYAKHLVTMSPPALLPPTQPASVVTSPVRHH